MSSVEQSTPRPMDPRAANALRIQREQQLHEREVAVDVLTEKPEVNGGLLAASQMVELTVSDDIEPSAARPERGKRRMRAYDWLEQTFGEQWWQKFGITLDLPPAKSLTVQTILKYLGLPEDSDRMVLIIEGWIDAQHPRELVRMRDDIANETFVTSTVNRIKQKLMRTVAEGGIVDGEPNLKKEVNSKVVRAHVGDWLAETFGVLWWKNFGYEEPNKVDLDIVIEQLLARTNFGDKDWRERAYFASWVKGFKLKDIGGNDYSTSAVSIVVDKVKGEIEGAEWAAKEVAKATPRAVGGQATRRAVTVATQPNRQEALAPSLGSLWAERIGLAASPANELVRYLNPRGSTIMNRDISSVAQKFVDYLTRQFETLDDETLELSTKQQEMLKDILGAWRPLSELKPGAPRRQTVARLVQSQNPSDMARVANEVHEAFEKLLAADTDRRNR